MTEQQIAEFIEQTGADRHMAQRYLGKAGYDTQKAIRDFYGGLPPPKKGDKGKGVEWFGGDSTAILSKDEPLGGNGNATPIGNSTPVHVTPVHCGSSAPKPIVLKNTDYSIPNQPKTRVRIEFDDLPPITLTVAMAHTIADVKSFIVANRPTLEGVPLKLVAKPNTELNDDSLTIEAGKLKMAMIKCTH